MILKSAATIPQYKKNSESQQILPKKISRKSFMIAAIGTIVEYYDYCLYGFAATIFAHHFFPQTDPTVALLQIFGIFAAGSVAKPMGSLVFGWIGDVYGRSQCLKISMIGIILPTATIALMPGYDQIGWVAPFILLCCRFTQGFFVSGESDGVRVFIFESIDKKWVCLGCSLIGMAAYIGIYAASLAMTIVQQFDNVAWLWRVPFIIGCFSGVVVMVFRRHLTESYDYQHDAKITIPYHTKSFHKIIFGILTTVMCCGASGGMYHIFFVFMPSYFSKVLMLLSPYDASVLNNIALFFHIIMLPLSGLAADKWGIYRVIQTACFVTFFLIIFLLINFESPETLQLLIPCTAIALSFCQGPAFVALMQQFPTSYRYRSVSIGHAIGSMLFSGSAPVISTWLWQKTSLNTAPLYYFFFLFLMSICGIFLVQKINKK